MLSLPIPSSLDLVSYYDLKGPGGQSVGEIISELAAGAKIEGKGAHADPDLVRDMRERLHGWRPSLGQIGAAGGHLRNQSVSEGDLFLFYGWFRHTCLDTGRLQFRSDVPGFHAIYGYLEIDSVVSARNSESLPEWLCSHPHAIPARLAKSTNVIYVAGDSLSVNPEIPGAGVFRFHDELVLTKPGLSRSRWSLNPDIFKHLPISYHSDCAWKDNYFQSYPRAQEYVINADERAGSWAYNLIAKSIRCSKHSPTPDGSAH